MCLHNNTKVVQIVVLTNTMSENESRASNQHAPLSPHHDDFLGVRDWCDTRQKEAYFSYVWNIYNFKSFPRKLNFFLESSTFSPKDNCETKFCLQIYPGGNTSEYEIEYVSVFLILKSSDEDVVTIKYNLGILDINMKKTEVKKSPTYGKPFKSSQNSWGYSNFISRADLLDPLNELLPEGNLTIFCKGSMIISTINCSGQSHQFKLPACRFSENFSALLDSEKFSDVRIKAGENEIKAHKVILSAQSPVFAAMFEHDMKENEENCVTITDVNYETLGEILRFMYTGRAPNLEKMARDLLVAADKYALERLKVMCEEYLFNNISIATAAETLILADMHSAEQLKTRTIDFIINRKHTKDVMKTLGWKNMITQAQARLIIEMFVALAAEKNLPTGPQ